MKKRKSKIFGLLLTFIIGIFGLCGNVKALSNQETFSSETLSGQYIKKLHSDGSGKYKSIGKIIRNSDGRFVYCVQPWMDLAGDNAYNANTVNQAEILGVSRDTWKRLGLIAYYGYGYPGHTDDRWYGITQLMIWQTVDPTGSFFFTYTANGNRDYRYDWMKDEIESLISSHYTDPSFNSTNVSLNIGSSTTLNDTNNVLSDFRVETNNDKVSATKDGNNLTITANDVGSTTITLIKELNEGAADNVSVLYDYLTAQKVMSRGFADPVYATLTVNVTGGKIKVIKVDKDTGTITAQGSASMVGTVIDIYNSSNSVVDTLTIGNDSTATSKELPIGNYKLVERTAGNGYIKTTQTYNVRISNSNTQEVTISNEVVKAKLKIFKYDSETKKCTAQGEALLKGAKYSVTNSKGVVVDTLTIGNDCSATSTLLPYDIYKVKEISSSTGYNLDTNTYTVNVNTTTDINLTVYEDVIKGKGRVKKIDIDNNNTTARGQATLVGAKYGIYDLSNNLVDTLTIGNDYQAISKYLPYGHYKIKEIETSTGYTLDTKVYEINITEQEQVIDITSKEKVIENFISILKQYDYVDGNTTLLNAESGITFEIYYPNGTKYSQITTDRNGYATLTIPYGVWRFHQVNSNTGFVKIYDFYVTVDENSESEQYYNILNNKLSSYLQVLKVDEETGKIIAIAHTKFRILNTDTNQYVSQYVGGKVYDTFETDEDGKFMTYLKIEAGNYKLVEISSPKNYLINTNGLEFTIGEDTHYSYTTYGPVVTVSFSDKQIKGVIEINKNGEVFAAEDETFNYNGRTNLEGIVYRIEANEDIKSADGNYIYYSEGTLVDTITTNVLGYAKSKELPLGKYRIYEYSTIGNYRLDSKVYEVELKDINNRTAVVYSNLELTNALKKGNLEFTKTDLVNGKPIKNTTISIYTDQDEKIFEGKTDKNGKVIIKDLPIEVKMYIIETDCEGYVLTDEKVYFEIKEDGEVVKAEMKNKPITGKLEFTKLNFVNDAPVENTLINIYSEDGTLEFSGRTDNNGKLVFENIRYGKHYILEEDAPEQFVLNTEKIWFEIKEDGEVVKAEMRNKVKTSTIKIHKVDDENNALAGVEIGIYDLEDNLLYSNVTDENGDIEVSLNYGSYYFQEIAGIDGYIMSDEKVYFDVTEDGKIIQKTFVNVPDTDTTERVITILKSVSSIMALTSITLYLYASYKYKIELCKKLREDRMEEDEEDEEDEDEEDF